MKKLLLTNIVMLMAVCMSAQTDIQARNMRKVSEESPINRTSYILNANFEDGLNNWDFDAFWTQSNSQFPQKSGTIYVEKWVTSTSSAGSGYVKQQLTNLPNGKYKLTVTAQNYSQGNVTKKNTGAYIYADDQQTTVYTPADYSVYFTNITGEVEIGFVANNATGNWLCVDNFRLYQIGEVGAEEAVDEVQRLVGIATDLQTNMMSGTTNIHRRV